MKGILLRGLLGIMTASFIGGTNPAIQTVYYDPEDVEVTDEDDKDEVPKIRQIEWEDTYSLYKVGYDGYIISYIILYGDGTYDTLSQDEVDYITASRVEAGESRANASAQYIDAEHFISKLKGEKLDTAEDKGQAQYELYQEITAQGIHNKFPGLTTDDLSTFTYTNDLGVIELWHCFSYDSTWYKISPDEYKNFINGYTSIYDDWEAANRGFGSGMLNLTLELGESLLPIDGTIDTQESFIVQCKNQSGEVFLFVVNPPTYVYYAALDDGEYMIDSVMSYEYPEYPILCDVTYFTISETEDTFLNLPIYRQQDHIEGVEYTDEEIKAIMDEGEEEYERHMQAVSADTVSGNFVVDPAKKGSKLVSIAIAFVVFLVIVGAALFVYKKGNEEER